MSQYSAIPFPAPKERDWLAYERYMVRGLSREEAARSLGVSEQELLDIVGRVNDYVVVRAARPHPELLQCILLERFEYQWREAMDAWYNSRSPEETTSMGTEEAETDRMGNGKRRRVKQTKRTRAGDVRFLAHARRLLLDMRWLQGVAPREDDSKSHELTEEERNARIRLILTQITDGLTREKEKPSETYPPLESMLKAS